MVQHGAQPNALLGRIASLADATRLRLLRLLERHELGVVELCDILQLPQSTVSRHLKVLGDQGWARSRRQGTTRLYRMILDELEPGARRLWLLTREQTEGWATIQQDALRLARHLRQRQEDSQAFFAGAAAQWDKLRGELYGNNFTTAALLALLPRDMVVADLGCGTGQVIAAVAPNVKQVIGVDNSAAMLKAAKKRASAFRNVELHRGDLQALPLGDVVCDAALLLLALTYVSDPTSVLHEMSRVLKPTGRAVIVDLLPHDRDDFRRQMGQQSSGFDPKQLASQITAAGFTQVQIIPLPPEPEAKGPALFLATAVKHSS
ncbi:MAG TPA: metalloregulator ArsR/SmtB family transcription factor [Tepidisphaeraceae bacterium]|nr:metalloregulator ArsR/SmtB family transcription factor [Tepidisphaeraceae bacterium]